MHRGLQIHEEMSLGIGGGKGVKVTSAVTRHEKTKKTEQSELN